MSHCSNHSCCGSHHHHHDHHHGSCGCCNENCSCPCHDEVCGDEESCSTEMLFEIADCAWAEVLKEKIKEHIRSTDNKIDGLAKIVAEANHKRWKNKMQKDACASEYEECCLDFEEELCRLFSGPCEIKKKK